ncbi:MAG: hypothetical protein K2P93_04410 [Alphaproteobacteria bacterium]|nr:hypothetical protein [Alphaproteobacteria bacterium]
MKKIVLMTSFMWLFTLYELEAKTRITLVNDFDPSKAPFVEVEDGFVNVSKGFWSHERITFDKHEIPKYQTASKSKSSHLTEPDKIEGKIQYKEDGKGPLKSVSCEFLPHGKSPSLQFIIINKAKPNTMECKIEEIKKNASVAENQSQI